MTQLVSYFTRILCVLQFVSGTVILTVFAPSEPPIICVRDEPVTITGTGPAHAGLLLYFDGRVVSGGSVADDGTFALALRVGDEQDGVYPVVVRERGTFHVLRELTCQVQDAVPSPTPPLPTATVLTEPTAMRLAPPIDAVATASVPTPVPQAGIEQPSVPPVPTASVPTISGTAGLTGASNPAPPAESMVVVEPVSSPRATAVTERLSITQSVSITVVAHADFPEDEAVDVAALSLDLATIIAGEPVQVVDAFGRVLIDTVTVARQPLVLRDTVVPGTYRAVVVPRYNLHIPLTEADESLLLMPPLMTGRVP